VTEKAVSDIPCPICGAVERHSHSDREIFAWIKDAARWMKDATKRIAELEALIADAPHHQDCPRSSKHSSFLSCNCWKSRALDTGAKG
jgi:uncharacterized protein (DUF1786 family)